MVDLCGFGVILMVLKIQFVCEFRGYIYIYIYISTFLPIYALYFNYACKCSKY